VRVALWAGEKAVEKAGQWVALRAVPRVSSRVGEKAA
jgi:hypothetical protein